MASTALKLIVSQRDRKTGEFTGWGELEFASRPRLGEFITRDVDGAVHAFLVIAFFHPDKPTAAAGEIWVEDRGALADLKKPNNARSFGFLSA
jgi:hypothetical protein